MSRWRQFGPTGPFHGSWFWKLRQIHKKGRIYDYKDFMAHLMWFVGEDSEHWFFF